ncbi:MAG: hypothetical protein IKH65_01725 [Clostridia bacterium]|nr:hypothetical protein [Clostridia bacterium]
MEGNNNYEVKDSSNCDSSSKGRYAYIPASFSLEEKANFDRCVNFMARMLEKYKEDVLLPEMEQDVEKATAE